MSIQIVVVLSVLSLFGCSGASQSTVIQLPQQSAPRIRRVNHIGNIEKAHFVSVAQCQFDIPIQVTDLGLHEVIPASAGYVDRRVRQCLALATERKAKIVVFPELTMALPKDTFDKLFAHFQEVAKANDVVVIAGSFYDQFRQSKILVVGSNWSEHGDKVNPSRFEASPVAGKGMSAGEELLVIETQYGTLAIITCVDLLSDEVQYLIRRMATRGEIDILFNINYNPAAWEFLVEANSIVRRHPIFATITNVAERLKEPEKGCVLTYCHGYTSVFGDMRMKASDKPNHIQAAKDLVPKDFLLPDDTRQVPYSNLIAAVAPTRQAVLIAEFNLRLKREPAATNAPDQGYPPVRSVEIIDLPSE